GERPCLPERRRGRAGLLLRHRLRRQHLDVVIGGDDHRNGPDDRNGELHRPRADRGWAGGRAGRHVLARLRPVRMPDGATTRRRIAAIVAAAVLVVAGATVAGVALNRGAAPPPPTASPELIREGVQVTASSTAPASHDAAGNVVTYQPSNVIDGDVETAWRTPGDGNGESVTLIFDNPVDVVKIGLIPGYAKTDPQTGVDRFFQDRV